MALFCDEFHTLVTLGLSLITDSRKGDQSKSFLGRHSWERMYKASSGNDCDTCLHGEAHGGPLLESAACPAVCPPSLGGTPRTGTPSPSPPVLVAFTGH